MNTPSWLKAERRCKYCADGLHGRRMVCCAKCWRGLPVALQHEWEQARRRGDDSRKIAALRAIAEHLSGQPELKL